MAKVVCTILAVLACFMLAESLDCNQCSIGLVGFCLNSNTITCTTNTSVCFTGRASFPGFTSFVGFNTQGCQEPAGCNMTTTGTLLGANYTTEVTCCSTDGCNPVTITSGASSAQLSLVAVLAATLMASGWSVL